MNIEIHFGVYFRNDLWEAHDISYRYPDNIPRHSIQPDMVIEEIEHILTHIQRSK